MEAKTIGEAFNLLSYTLLNDLDAYNKQQITKTEYEGRLTKARYDIEHYMIGVRNRDRVRHEGEISSRERDVARELVAALGRGDIADRRGLERIMERLKLLPPTDKDFNS